MTLVAQAGLPPNPWEGRAVLVLTRSVWFRDDKDQLLALTTADLDPGPCGLSVAGPLPQLRPGLRLERHGAAWTLEGHGPLDGPAPHDVARRLPARGPRLDQPTRRVWASWAATALPATPEGQWLAALLETSPQPSQVLGRGTGSTPSGDDYAAGWLAARLTRGAWSPAQDHDLRTRLPATAALSRHFLRHLLEGRVSSTLADLLEADTFPLPTDPRAVALARCGDLSGRATLVGLVAGLTTEPAQGA